MKSSLSIIVPAYNEEKNIPSILKEFRNIHEENIFELVLVDNGSTDNSAMILEKEMKKEKNHFVTIVTIKKNVGYGHGIMSGLKASRGDILCWTHADMQTPPIDCIRAYKALLENNDDNTLIKGKRLKRSMGGYLFTLGMSLLASIVLGKFLYDINAQPKIFPRSFLKKMKNPPDDFSLDLYCLYLAKKKGYKIRTIDVTFKNRLFGESKWAFSISSKIKTIWRTIKYIFYVKNYS